MSVDSLWLAVTRRVTTNFEEARSDLLQDGMPLIRLAL